MRIKTLPKYYSLFVTLSIVLLDQITKYLARKYLIGGFAPTFIPYLVQFRIVRNYGAAFSILNNQSFYLGFISLFASIALIIWIARLPRILNLKTLAASILLGGTIGNGLDRWCYGYVIDFIELIPINFPIFNIADISINIAVILFLTGYFKSK